MIKLRPDRRLFALLQMLLFLMLAGCQSVAQELPLSDQQKLDRLLTLMDQRLEVAVMVAQTKWNSGAPIDDPEREGQILDAMSGSLSAMDAAMDTAMARRFFQAQFDAGKVIQRALHAQWQSQAHERFTNPPELVRDIRPALDRITPLLIDALRQVGPLLQNASTSASARRYVQQRAATLVRADVNGAARDEAIRPLLQ